MRIKLRDIATRAHVSTATVSRVLNNNPNVDERTRATVFQALKEIGYPLPGVQPGINKGIVVVTRGFVRNRPDPSALDGINTGAGSLPDFNSMVVDGIEIVTRQAGIPMNIQRLHLENPATEDIIQLSQVADGIILVGGLVSPEVIDIFEQAGQPFVQAAARVSGREINSVEGDYLNAAAQATQALAQLGHHHIAFINGPVISTTSRDKLAGYKLGLSEAGLPYNPRLSVEAEEFHLLVGYEATQKLLRQTREFSAILYASDTLAMGGLRALKDAELEVPGQVSVMGFYDEPIAQFADPPLSSVHIDWQRLGTVAALRLVALLEHKDEERLRIIMPMRPVLRGSTAPFA